MKSPRLSHIAAPALALCSLATLVSAQQTFLDQQPSQSFTLFTTAGVEATADNFVVTDPNGIAINTIRIWGTWTNTGIPTSDTFNIVFHDDDNTGPFGPVPGVTLSTYSGVTPTVTATGLMIQTGATTFLDEHLLLFTLSTPMTLMPGTYWVEFYSTGSSGSADEFVWEMAPQDFVNGAMCMSWSFDTPGVTWNACTPFPETDMSLVLSNETVTIGNSYCPANPNITGVPTSIFAVGSSAAADNSVTLNIENATPNAFAYFLNSMTQGNVANPGGSAGILCLGGSVGRYNQSIFNTGASGTGSLVLDLTMTPQPTGLVSVMAGETWNFQCWHRDITSGGAATSNFSNGVEITFQ